MKPFLASMPLVAFWASQAFAAAFPTTTDLEPRDTADVACENGPLSRACWSDGYSIATDFDRNSHLQARLWYVKAKGGSVVFMSETSAYPMRLTLGHAERLCFLINGVYPGPTIRANWGDYLVINVTNSMQDNGTSIHWHSVRQYHTPGADGVGGLTRLRPGTSRVHAFNVTQFGTSWYHAHYSSQYGDGDVGTIIFDGPASGNYDEDLGVYTLSEWYYQTAFQINALTNVNLQNKAPPPNADNMLINGTNKDADGNGNYGQVTVESDKKYRLRLVNINVDNYIQVSLDNHPFEVIAADFTAGNYWFRSNVSSDCQSGSNFYGRAIWSYSNVTSSTPQSTAFTEPTTCDPSGPLTPYWDQSVPSSEFESQLNNMGVNLTQAVVVADTSAIVVWSLNASIAVSWQNSTLSYVMNGNTSYPKELDLVETTAVGGWNYWLLQQATDNPSLPHPIHLHRPDFFVLGYGSSAHNSSTANLNFDNPTRRDTASIPGGGGWLAVAFQSNNAGSWLMHCYITWHVSEDLGMQFLESPD
ncbi:hypothetical protein B0A54_07922 [Lecanosticta acicola]|uniref:laccase n=1 Tax=Lecanosticta acicola TaxID=111012 RepID=A0AAI8Z133_9PEZI|nr:hypothetical protein B0A54_07922 [Lecanosticta acicola]